MPHQLDDTDITILQTLQADARIQRNKIAEMVHLSVPSISERMKKLEEKNLISGYHAHLNSKAFHLDITAYIFVEVDGSHNYESFVHHASSFPEVLECHSITGDGSHMLKIRTHNTTSLEKLLSEIQSWKGVHKTRTNIVLSSFKETTNIPLKKEI